MKIGKKFPIAVGLLLFVVLVTSSVPVSVATTITGIPNQRTTDSPRHQTMWMAGSYNGAGNFIPWSTGLHPGTD
ncbi:MAG: hypothetical protein ACFE9S_14860, partial [Candidatus Hermodarchaeota archaeon]